MTSAAAEFLVTTVPNIVGHEPLPPTSMLMCADKRGDPATMVPVIEAVFDATDPAETVDPVAPMLLIV
ncbi:hypothetical protein [Rhizobium rhizogenes]|uniref:hypothetical protein n=1 Tax=Rhizobium rhizogenes TaxID=359 RepID=UPI001574567B|nr:hypothetical protein [Rhizobium rhizogenes]NTG09272.1 hypothetical protein [Rhizobium rhizogenes]